MDIPKRALVLLLFSAFLSRTASGSFIQINGQALPLNQGLPNQDSYNLRSDDGALTSLQYDTGLLFGNSGSARSAASVDIELGTLDLYTEINNKEAANATSSLFDNLFFDLPDGMLSAEVTLSMEVEGALSGIFSGCSICVWGRLGFGFAGTALPDQKVEYIEKDFEQTGLPQLFSITRTVFEGNAIRVDSVIRSTSNGVSSDPSSFADLFASLSLTTPDGVTFTSESGAFLDDPFMPPPSGVPAPATLALFGLGLAGLGWSRRKKA